MVKTSYSLDLFSHLNKENGETKLKLLTDHVNKMQIYANAILDNIILNIDDYIPRDILQDIISRAITFHDLGKATPFFQDYLLKSKDSGILKNHSKLSSIICLVQNQDFNDLRQFLIPYLLIRHHHGNLVKPNNSLADFYDDYEKENLAKQVNSLFEIENSVNILLKHLNINSTLNNIKTAVESQIWKKARNRIDVLSNNCDPNIFIITQFLYSLLIDADKSDAADLSIPVRRFDIIAPDIVDKYMKIKQLEWKDNSSNSNINKLRNEVYNDLSNKIENIDLNHHIFSINAPTGLGKTTAGFNFAIKLRTRLKKEKNIEARIIYSLPFLSIIDQNYDVLAEILKDIFKMKDNKVATNLLLKHHHLSDIEFLSLKKADKDEENIIEDVFESKALIESWNSEIIVTTFYQFFHTLFGYRNSQLRKYHKMANSIIILDEIQSFPVKYWSLFREIAINFCNMFNSYIILMTATTPEIFIDEQNKNHCYELLDNRDRLFKSFNRYQILPQLQISNIDQLPSLINQYPDKSILFVLNTIQSVSYLHDLINEFPEPRTFSLYYLSSYITPFERLERIKLIKKDKNRKVLVSTQLIEAGVDLDFDIVVRDFAPFDSIVQSAGRCNRNGKRECGKVIITELKDKDKNGIPFYSYIYSRQSVLILQTREILKQWINKKIPESEIPNLCCEYFKSVHQYSFQELEIFKEACKLNFDGDDKSLSRFKLIEDELPEIDIFIEINDEAKNAWRDRKAAMQIKDWKGRYKALLKNKSSFYKFVISISQRVFKLNPPPLVDNYYYVQYESIIELKPRYYKRDTGYIINSSPFIL